MNREILYFKQLFLKNIQLLFLGFIVMYISFASTIGFLLFGFILIYIFSIVVVLIMMDYQYRRYSIDFYYALPIKRKRMFWIHAIVAICYILIPLILILMIIPKKYDFYNDMLLTIPFVFLNVVVLIAITAFSNSRVDSVLLCLLYPIMLIVLYAGLHTLISPTYVYGIDITARSILNYLRLFLLLISFRELAEYPLFIVYSIGFIVQVVFWIGVSNYFVKKRQVEHAGIGNLKSRRYQLVKFIATFVMFLGIASIYTNMNSYNAIYSIQDFFKFILGFIQTQFGNILVGFVVYLIIATIVQRKVDQVIKHIIHYVVILMSFSLIFAIVTVIKRVVYEEKIPTIVNRVQIGHESEYYKDSLLPRIATEKSNEMYSFESEEVKKYVIQLHENLLKNRNNYFQIPVEFTYNANSALQLKRSYQLNQNQLNSLIRVLLSSSGEFKDKVFSLLDSNKEVYIMYDNLSKKISIDDKDRVSQFILYYLKNYNVQQYRYKNTKMVILHLGKNHIYLPVFEDSDIEVEVKKILK